jgi:senataxin
MLGVITYSARQFDDDTVTELSDRLDSIDFLRLDSGLESAEKLLARVDPAQRTQAVLAKNDSAALLALYEALCCVNYHRSNDHLAKHFDYVFEQIQSRKILRIGDILPAMARFLFSRNQFRHRFATNAWQKMSSELTVKTFEWVVTDVLTEAIMLVSMPSADPEDILRFWQGFSLMLERMDKSLITHSLRGMEVQPDIFYLALQHLSSNSETIVTLVIDTLRRFLIKSPKDLWSAFGAVSPATVAEQIFRSPGFEKMLSNPKTFETFETSPAISWIVVLLKSLDPIHQYDACRSMLINLFERLQENSFPEGARLACCRVGLDAIHTTLQAFITSDYKINPSTSLIVINNIMGLVDQYKGTIVGCADLEDKENGNQQLKNLGMVVIKDALALDCKATSAEFYALENGTPVQRGDRSHSQSIWQAVLDIFRPGNMELAKSILPATSTLIGLDELHPEAKKRPLPKDHIQFNKDLHELMDNIARIFERLSDFSTSDLMKMHMDPVTSRPLFAALISADEGISQAAVEVVKAATGQSGKRDAIQSMMESAFIPFLNSITYAVIRTCKAKTFGPIPFMVKTGREILKALCGNTGILRTRSTFTTAEQNAIILWWTNQWKALDHIFSTTESWAKRVDRPSAEMQDFCRDCMEYAELLFNEYNIFASALRELSPSDDELTSGKSSASMVSHRKVLEVICLNINGLVGMLRLRDSYLVTVITSLLGKLLRCLGEYQLEVADYALEYITDACKRDDEHPIRKTNLTNQQKAELLRALDEHQGVEVIEISRPSIFKKQGTIDAWTKSADRLQHEPKLPSKSHALPMASSSEKNKAILEKMRAKEALKSQSIDVFKEKRRKVEEERNRVKAEAVARAQAMRTATVRGEGSGIKDIGGVFGKDHAPTRSEIMVGSSDEDSEDDADEDETNALVKTRKERSSKALEIEESRRRAQMKQPHGPVKKTKVQRSAKDLRARVEPNMDGLYFEILSWDIFHRGDTPPSNNECRRIDNTYLDLNLYKRTFGPLLISEIWRSLVTAKEENNFKPIEIKVLNRLSVDKFLEVTTSIPMSLNRDLKLSERDIVLLSRGSDPLGNEQEPHCLARVDRTTRKKDRIEVTMRVSRDINPAFLQCLFPNGKIYGVKIADMTTAQREFAALSSLEYYDLCSEVLEAKPSPIHKYGDEKISQVTAKYSLNKGQAQAILSANDNDGFTLIQG